MKYTLFTIVFFIVTGNVFSQSPARDIKTVQRNLAKINERLYASKFEVSNKDYDIFLNDLKIKGESAKLEIAKIDSTNWSQTYEFGEPFKVNYHKHPAYANYPVVNISYDGAVLYCEWLTEQYNESSKRKFNKVVFRLPSEKEWIAAAKGGDESAVYPWKGDDLINRKNQPNCNWRSNVFVDNADITSPVKSYIPNAYGIYNMSGNVAEMIAERGHTKGGSYRDSEESMKIDGPDSYKNIDTSSTAIGFRYFMEVLEH